MQTTAHEYDTLSEAFSYFNETLFDNELPDALITLQRGNYRGFFSPEKFQSRTADGLRTHEIGMNPDEYGGRSDVEILSTLAHEMVHLWERHFGKPRKGNYHGKVFAQKMEDIGLHTTDDGTWDGKRTGGKVSHLIIPGGKFELAATDFIERNKLKIHWQSERKTKEEKLFDPSKVKFSCKCETPRNIWAKAFTVSLCPVCLEIFRWKDAGKIEAWIRDNLNNEAFKTAFEAFNSDMELCESLVSSMWEALELEEQE